MFKEKRMLRPFHFLVLYIALVAGNVSYSVEEERKASPLSASLKALGSVKKVKKIKKKFKYQFENKLKNMVSGVIISENVAKRLSGAAVMIFTKEFRVRYKDFKLKFDNEELSIFYGKGF